MNPNKYECPNCGYDMSQNDYECKYCGNKNPNYKKPFSIITPTVHNEYSSLPKSNKSKIACGLLQIFLGGLGIGRFYSGHVGIGIAQILVTFFTCGWGSIWGFIDGIIILLAKDFRDADGKIME